jgi:hypothetical protein
MAQREPALKKQQGEKRMWPYIFAAIAGRMVFSRGKKAFLKHKELRDLKAYGASIGCAYINGEDMSNYRKKLITVRDKKLALSR